MGLDALEIDIFVNRDVILGAVQTVTDSVFSALASDPLLA